MLRLVTLDVTNTLLRFSRPPGEQYAAVGELYGVKADPKKLISAFRSSFKKFEKEIPYYGASNIGWQSWWLAVVANTFREANCSADNETLRKIGSHLNKHYSQGSAYKLIEGSLPLLNKLQEKSLKIGVISNFDERLDSILLQLGIKHYFDFVITSYSFSCSKPDPKIFEKALEAAGSEILPSQALHIGDDLKCDYFGARACGWQSVLVSKDLLNECHKGNIEPDYSSMFTCLAKVLPLLEGSN